MLCGALIACAAGFLGSGDFTTRIDNPYLPMRPGSRWVYRETDVEGTVQRVVVKVTRRTKRIATGVTARVVRDTVTERGRLVEDTFDWFAQDRAGNVWYLGEDTTEYEKGRPVSKAGSWEAGWTAPGAASSCSRGHGPDGATARSTIRVRPRIALAC